MAAWNGPGSGLCASVARVQYQVLLILGPAGPAARAVFRQLLVLMSTENPTLIRIICVACLW